MSRNLQSNMEATVDSNLAARINSSNNFRSYRIKSFFSDKNYCRHKIRIINWPFIYDKGKCNSKNFSRGSSPKSIHLVWLVKDINNLTNLTHSFININYRLIRRYLYRKSAALKNSYFLLIKFKEQLFL